MIDPRLETLARLIRHGVEALRDGDGDAITARATLANLDQLVTIAQTGETMHTLAEIEAMPTLHQGQYENLKVERDGVRVWLSRLTVEDGQPYNNQVVVERIEGGRWVLVREYEAK